MTFDVDGEEFVEALVYAAAIYVLGRAAGRLLLPSGPDRADRPDRLLLDAFDLDVLADGHAVRVASEQGEVMWLTTTDPAEEISEVVDTDQSDDGAET
ncbi:hypothetical protein [Halomicrobium urmianum]|uniref:hypothetical protein n=1 Tax=Halomicrobium urmianum TaxID=1586233 RepID=UPI001CDA0F33|nr:hypothetical protein [Halomicrobium urmianum]